MSIRIEINPRYSALRSFIADIPARFDSEGVTLLDARNTVKSITAPDGTRLVVKRFGRLSWVRRLIYSTVSTPKARRAYLYGMRYLDLGFATPEPVAYIEIYRRGLLLDCYFISLHSDATELFPLMVTSEHYDRRLADRVAELMAELHSKGAIHGDPNLKNILTEGYDSPLVLIDTNRSSFHHKLSRNRCLHNVMRISHRRDLITHIAGRYADLRGYDRDATVKTVIGLLRRFERNRRLRHRLKSIITGRPVE